MPAPFPTRSLTELLLEQHGLFRRALALFGRYAEQAVSGNRYDPRLARAQLNFFRLFADQRHHDMEERVLFPWMEAHGLPRRSGPLVVLKFEHDLGRDLRQELERVVHTLLGSPNRLAVRVRFHGLALRFAELFPALLRKEEQVVFPLVTQNAARNGGELRITGRPPVRDATWISTLEEDVGVSWPRPTLSLRGLGTPEGFERLCRSSLAVGKNVGNRHSEVAQR